MTIGTVELKPDQSADPGKCGSCELFQRFDGAGGGVGRCNLAMPPHVVLKQWDDETDPATTYDDRSCSFYRSRDVQFTKQIVWTVPQNVMR